MTAPRAETGGAPVRMTVDWLAQQIRLVDGENSLGAGALAEALLPRIRSTLIEPAPAMGGEVEACPRCHGDRAPLASSHTAVEPVGELVERLRAQTTIHLTDLNAVRSYLDNDSILHHEAAAALVAAEKERDQLIAAVKLMEYSAGDAAHWRGLCDHAVARTEAAESEVATLKGRVAELEAGDRDANLALDFYASEAEAIVRHMQSGNTAALEAIMRVLSLDGGARARRLTSPEEKSNG